MRALVAIPLLFVGVIAACSSTNTTVIPGGGDGGPGSGVDGGGGGGGEGGGGSGLSIAEGCAKQAVGFCASFKKCQAFGFGIDFADAAECETNLTTACIGSSAVPDSNRTGDDAAACGVLLGNRECSNGNGCAVVPGKRPTGAACQYSASCASGYCGVAAVGTCGICVDPVGLGATCSVTSPCDYTKNIYCGSGGKCIAYAAAGDACGMTGQPVCTYGLACVNKKCGVGGAVGDMCGSSVPCETNAATFCDSTAMKCTAATFLPPGSACGGAGLSNYCRGGLCSPNAGGMGSACVPNLPDGATCDPMAKTTGRCATFLSCNTNNKCGIAEDLACN